MHQEYILKKKNLPADVLALKEIARRILSANKYKLLRKHTLIVKKFRGWSYRGTYFRYRYNIELDGRYGLLEPGSIDTWIHEVAHMVFDSHKRKKRSIGVSGRRTKVHSKAFYRLLRRLKQNYETKVKQSLPEIVSLCQGKQSQRTNRLVERTEAIARMRSETKLSSHKLAQTQKAIYRWEGKLRRCETHLKKLRRREKLYIRLTQKKEGGLSPSISESRKNGRAEIGETA
jgi:hypothetical protein